MWVLIKGTSKRAYNYAVKRVRIGDVRVSNFIPLLSKSLYFH